MIVGLLVPRRGSVAHFKITPRFHTITPEWVLHSNFGCCIGTIPKSATYKICGALERRKFIYMNLLVAMLLGSVKGIFIWIILHAEAGRLAVCG